MTDDSADKRVEDLRSSIKESLGEVPRRAEAVAKREFRRGWSRAIVANFIVTVIVSALMVGSGVVLFGRTSDLRSEVSNLQRAETAKAEGDAANRDLVERGQPAVPIPTPGTAADADVIVAAATAKVLASLPVPRPSTTELGRAVADYIRDNPIVPLGPTPQQISASLAGYFITNPIPTPPPPEPGRVGDQGPKGDRGDKGDPGRPPSADEIQSAFEDYVRANPNILCPNGGTFGQLRLRLDDGGSADVWNCVITIYPPSPTPTSTTGIPILPTN